MRVVIIDDEAPARERLRRLLGEIQGVEVAGEAADGREGLEAAQALAADVALVDIRMPGMDGIEAARHMTKLQNPPAVIFTTAYGEHALEAFEAQALDYLLKPIRKERLEQALSRARQLTTHQLDALPTPPPGGRKHLSTQHQGNLRLIPIDEILYLQADSKYVSAYLVDARTVILDDTLKGMEEEFGDRFVRIHRNALVRRDALRGMQKGTDGVYHAQLLGSEDRPEISRRHVSAVRRLLKAQP